MKKIIILAMVMVFLSTGVSFAENWVMYYDGGSLKSFFDADKVVTKSNGFDYWIRDTFNPEFLGQQYFVQHLQVERRTGEWWIQILESWYIDTQGAKNGYYSHPANWGLMKWSEEPHGKTLLNGLKKYAR